MTARLLDAIASAPPLSCPDGDEDVTYDIDMSGYRPVVTRVHCVVHGDYVYDSDTHGWIALSASGERPILPY